MNEISVSLQEMLEARERRAKRQEKLLRSHKKPLVCFTMNIAGPIKNNDAILWAFRQGIKQIRHWLLTSGMEILFEEESNEPAGNEFYCVVDGDALLLKKLMVEIEELSETARLFDIDVIAMEATGDNASKTDDATDTNNALVADNAERSENNTIKHIGRAQINAPERKCLVCQKPAKECARSHAHNIEELQEKTRLLLKNAQKEFLAEKIARLACQSLLYEVSATPKPGLVDRRNNGSHKDTDFYSFIRSSVALYGYFKACAESGIDGAGENPRATFKRIRALGKNAEREMLAATNGANTHRGAIFSIGILCAALGRLSPASWKDTERVLNECAALAKGVSAEDFADVRAESALTNGQRIFARHGIKGARGQAEAGFPAVLRAGLPAMERAFGIGMDTDMAGAVTLLALMAESIDTNLISRSDLETQQEISRRMKRLVSSGLENLTKEEISAIDDEFIEKNLSPGGSADLLAMTCFLYFLKREENDE